MRRSNRTFSFRRSIRLAGYDYRQPGIYFVTICTFQKMPMFGSILDGDMHLNELGMVAFREWEHLASARPNVELDNFVVMPNHIHGLIVIKPCQKPDTPGQVPAQQQSQSRTLKANSLGTIIGHYKAAVSRRSNGIMPDSCPRIWQRNYHEHIVRNEQTLNDIRRYIIENPARWEEDSFYIE